MSIQRAISLAGATFGILLMLELPASAQKPLMRTAPAPSAAAPSVFHRTPSASTRTTSVVNRSRSGSQANSAHRSGPQRADSSAFNGFGGFGGVGGSQGLQNLLNLTPTSGFDYQFLNAINSDLAKKALVDPVTQLEIAQAVRIQRALSGGGVSGAYILDGGGYYVPSESDQGSPPTEDAAEASDAQPQEQQQPEQNAQEPVSEDQSGSLVRDEGQFTLVLNDGKQIQALAFSHSKDKIIYITPDGGRESIAYDQLDADATVRVNQERGTPLQLPL